MRTSVMEGRNTMQNQKYLLHQCLRMAIKAHLKIGRTHKAIIICGFCAIGKTYLLSKKDRLPLGMDIRDLDSSNYSKSEFPENYVSDVRRLANKPCIILISTHQGVPTQLAKEGYYVALVYPSNSPEVKQEWLRRLEEREQGGKDSRLYKMTERNWDSWQERTSGEEVSRKWILSKDQYLDSIFQEIYDDFQKQQADQERTKRAIFRWWNR
ncbi:hypothetical protein F5883DRAFT_719899 [Diaporthe sp. PMI_573]|nr:hypothetical protein F5883DRAFT_719899 [Diaporthaceae sp. PMI_573]